MNPIATVGDELGLELLADLAEVGLSLVIVTPSLLAATLTPRAAVWKPGTLTH